MCSAHTVQHCAAELSVLLLLPPCSFCLCLNKPWNRAETQDTGRPQEGVSDAPLILSTASFPDLIKLQKLLGVGWGSHTSPWTPTEHLGPPGLLHLQYKQARLQALETMAEVLKERIDILTTKLHKSTPQDTAEDLTSDLLPLDPSMAPAIPTLTPPSSLRTLMSKAGREAPQAKPLLPSTYFQDGKMLPWSPGWETQSPNLRTHIESQLQGGAGKWVSCLMGDPWARSNRAPFHFLPGEQDGSCPNNESSDKS